MRHTLLFLFLWLALLQLPAHAQQPRLLRDAPPPGWRGCVPDAEPVQPPPPQQRHEAERLAVSASQAAILGDTRTALDLLTRAARLDPSSAEIAFQLARAYEELDRGAEAAIAYCRYVLLAPDAPDAADVSARIAALAGTGRARTLPAEATQSFETGVAFYDARQLRQAEAAFTTAHQRAPNWPAPLYNRAVVRLELDRRDAAAADLRHYLRLGAGPGHADEVAALLASLPGGMRPPFQSRNALVAGMLVPGLGHFLTDRPVTGGVVLAGAAAALAAGLMVERVRVQCLSPPVDGRCPPELEVGRTADRPLLLPGAAVAAAITFLGAYDAYRGAERRNAALAERLRTGVIIGSGNMTVAGPALGLDRQGPRLDLVRFRF
jgi:Flp pilus assembly protein TadD